MNKSIASLDVLDEHLRNHMGESWPEDVIKAIIEVYKGNETACDNLVNNIPKVMNLKEVLGHFLDFRREVIINRTKFELKEAEARAHILEGLKIAQENIDEIIILIKQSSDPEAAKSTLISRFSLTEIQAKAILDMRLQRLTSLEVNKIIKRHHVFNDIPLLRRELISKKYLFRTDDCNKYWKD